MRKPLIPWSERLPRPFEGFSRELEGLMDRFFGEGSWSGGQTFSPHANLAETEEAYEVSIDLPGMKPDAINVEIQEGNLVVSGERSDEKEEKDKTFHRVERSYGSFRRAITLPGTVDAERIAAVFTDGVLNITLPKCEKEPPQQIPVKGEAAEEDPAG